MRIAVVSDIHGNLTALEAVVSDLRSVSPDFVIHGGDLVASGSRPAEILDLIRVLGWPGVQGNTDEMLWRPELLAELEERVPSRQGLRRVLFNDIAPATCEAIGEKRLEWLRALPKSWQQGDLVVIHASPDDLWRAPLAQSSEKTLRTIYGVFGIPMVVYGHIHHPYIKRLSGLTVANSGSVSLSYDGDPRASYALIDDGTVTIRRVEYDVEQEIRELQMASYPRSEWLASILRTGAYIPPSP